MKKSFGILGLAAAMLGGLATTSTTSGPSNGNTVEVKQAQGTNSKTPANMASQLGAEAGIEYTVTNPYGPGPMFLGRTSRAGMPPKQWGQHLQSTGKQRWTKGKGRKYIS